MIQLVYWMFQDLNTQEVLSLEQTYDTYKFTQRLQEYDFYKSILIYSVVLGHTITALLIEISPILRLHIFIRSFDMPFFAFISGYFLKKSCRKREWYKNFLKKLTQILVPVIVWSVIYNIAIILIGIKYSLFDITHFWFLWSILACSYLVIIIDRIFQKYTLLKFFIFIAALIATHIVTLPANIGFLLFPFLVGFYKEDLSCKIQRYKILKPIAVVLFFILEFFWTGQFSVWNIGCNIFAFGTPLLTGLEMCYRGIIGIFGSVVMGFMFDIIYNLRTKNESFEKIVNFIELVGRNTLPIYILQTFFVETFLSHFVSCIVKNVGINIFNNIQFLNIVIVLFIASVMLIFLYYLQILIRKIPIIGKYIFGFSAL